jgi:maltose O-acetyltransferase
MNPSQATPMRSEKEKMLAGELYDPADAQLSAERQRARELWHALNALGPRDNERRHALLAELLGAANGADIQPPFFCDYGSQIEIGRNAYFNVNCVVLDVMPVRIGDNALFGPGVQIYTASHPMTTAGRRAGLECAKPVTIGDDVWVGGSAVVCPGVVIGSGSVIGAGSVVTRSIPEGVLAAGNPCRVIRRL